MNSNTNRKAIIQKRRKELETKYGSNPVVYSSGVGVNSEEQYLSKLKINLETTVIKRLLQ